MPEALTEQEIRAILIKGRSISDADWVHHTRDRSLRTIYHMCEALRVSPGRLMSFRELHDTFRKTLRAAGLPPPPDGFNPVDHVSALWYIYEKRKKLEGDFVPDITELLDRTPEDRTRNSRYSYRVRYKYHAVVDKILDELNGVTQVADEAETDSRFPRGLEVAAPPPPATQPTAEEETEAETEQQENEQEEAPKPVRDAVVLASIQSRRGQQKFRATLLDAYSSKCAVTGCNTVHVLEAAHIIPHSEQASYSVNAGILLRADIHTLFDLFLLSIEPESGRVVVADDCKPGYGEFHGIAVKFPASPSELPDPGLLMIHFQKWKERNRG